MLTDSQIRTGLGDALTGVAGPGAPRIERAVADSRLCRAGDLFVALPGETLDGNDYVADAFDRGAVAALAARIPAAVPDGRTVYVAPETLSALQRLATWWRQRFNPRVVAITGTVGKTSTKEITAHVLSRSARVLKTESSLNGEIGLPLMLLRLTAEHEIAVLELGLFYAGEITLQCEIARPSHGIVTNVGYTHAERLGSIDAIAVAKRELVEWMPADAAVALNMDDPRVAAMSGHARCRVAGYGLGPDLEIRADEVEDFGLAGFGFRINARGRTARIRTPLIGRHNVYNCLAAAGVALDLGMTLAEIADALSTATNPLRLKQVPGPHGSTLIDDTYNANPASMNAALDLLEVAAGQGGRRIAVLGDMLELGYEEDRLHRELGFRAAQSADILLLSGTRARLTAEAARESGGAEVRYVENPDGLTDAVLALAKPGDIILLKASRGMEFERIVEALRRSGGAAPDVPTSNAGETSRTGSGVGSV